MNGECLDEGTPTVVPRSGLLVGMTRVGAWVARGAAVLLPTVTFYSSGLAASTYFALGILFGLVLLRRRGLGAIVREPLVAVLAGVLGFGLLSVLWSVVPSKSMGTALNLLLLLPPAALLLSGVGQTALMNLRLPTYAAFGLFLALALVVFESVTGNALLHLVDPGAWRPRLAEVTDFNRGFALLVLLGFPVAGWLCLMGRPRLGFGLVLACLGASFAGNGMAAKAAAGAGAVAAAAALLALPLARRAMWLAVALYCGLLPFAVGWLHDIRDVLPASLIVEASGRVEFWDHLDRQAWQRPVLGWGLAASGQLPPVPAADGYDPGYIGRQASYAHNGPLEVRIDFGVTGLVLLALVIGWTLRGAGALPPPLQPFALGCFATALTLGSLGFQTWSDTTLFLYSAPALLFGLAAGFSNTEG